MPFSRVEIMIFLEETDPKGCSERRFHPFRRHLQVDGDGGTRCRWRWNRC